MLNVEYITSMATKAFQFSLKSSRFGALQWAFHSRNFRCTNNKNYHKILVESKERDSWVEKVSFETRGESSHSEVCLIYFTAEKKCEEESSATGRKNLNSRVYREIKKLSSRTSRMCMFASNYKLFAIMPPIKKRRNFLVKCWKSHAKILKVDPAWENFIRFLSRCVTKEASWLSHHLMKFSFL